MSASSARARLRKQLEAKEYRLLPRAESIKESFPLFKTRVTENLTKSDPEKYLKKEFAELCACVCINGDTLDKAGYGVLELKFIYLTTKTPMPYSFSLSDIEEVAEGIKSDEAESRPLSVKEVATHKKSLADILLVFLDDFPMMSLLKYFTSPKIADIYHRLCKHSAEKLMQEYGYCDENINLIDGATPAAILADLGHKHGYLLHYFLAQLFPDSWCDKTTKQKVLEDALSGKAYDEGARADPDFQELIAAFPDAYNLKSFKEEHEEFKKIDKEEFTAQKQNYLDCYAQAIKNRAPLQDIGPHGVLSVIFNILQIGIFIHDINAEEMQEIFVKATRACYQKISDDVVTTKKLNNIGTLLMDYVSQKDPNPVKTASILYGFDQAHFINESESHLVLEEAILGKLIQIPGLAGVVDDSVY